MFGNRFARFPERYHHYRGRIIHPGNNWKSRKTVWHCMSFIFISCRAPVREIIRTSCRRPNVVQTSSILMFPSSNKMLYEKQSHKKILAQLLRCRAASFPVCAADGQDQVRAVHRGRVPIVSVEGQDHQRGKVHGGVQGYEVVVNPVDVLTHTLPEVILSSSLTHTLPITSSFFSHKILCMLVLIMWSRQGRGFVPSS